MQAIRNLEHEQATVEERPSARPEGVLPLPPQPYFAHPYALQRNFTGRARERRELTEWFTSDTRPVFAYIAIGGMGKSALTWAWLQRDVLGLPLPGVAEEERAEHAAPVPEHLRPEGVLWWSFYERENTFQKFLDEALTYASGGRVDPRAIPSIRDRMQSLYHLLCQRRFLLVLDGVERILRAYSCMDAAYRGDEFEKDERGDFRSCTDPNAGTFLQWLTSVTMKSKVLLTSRLFPRELDDLAGCRRVNLAAFDPEDAAIFFHAQRVRGTRTEIETECDKYGYHPLSLRLLSGMIIEDPQRPGDIRAAAKYNLISALVPREHHILALAYDALRPSLREFLSRLAAFRSPVEYKTIEVVFGKPEEETGLGAALKRLFTSRRLPKPPTDLIASLKELVNRGLLLFDRERGRYDLHPIVRGYAYDRLADKEGTHTRLRDHFAAVPAPRKVESLDDLAPVIELYHHTVRAGHYDEAMDLYYHRLWNPLYYRFGAYQTEMELLRALFPDGEDRPPQLKHESDQAWTLNELANSYSLSGQPRRAALVWRVALPLAEKLGQKKNVAIGLGNLATQQVILGDLAAAEQSLQQDIELCREIGGKFWEGVAHRILGQVLAYRGEFKKSEQELTIATDLHTEVRHQWGVGITWAYHALRALLMGDAKAALKAASKARELADVERLEADIIRAEWLLGAAHCALGHMPEADTHLTEALTRCRRINMIYHEPDILLEMARLRWAQAQGREVTSDESTRLREEALGLAREALGIADRCEYRLKQADIHNFLAQVALEKGDREEAQKQAEIAKERAWCDGLPHCYKPALEETERVLEWCGGK